MSANNQLVIKKRGENWTVSDIDAETRKGFLISDMVYKNLKAAIRAANKYMADNEVEYGLDVKI